MNPGLPFADLLAYDADQTNCWKRWFDTLQMQGTEIFAELLA